ncbi:lipopolysaccharide assembly protein LapA domain-containing protein [Maridesulfovibrio sp.]|uniref:lipopolysaccharide assembly protein LapA domain-containing protein n=1 Tax=Maridesulfovibrio sp. TaxID=2795000 RepID=UPI0039EE2148
MQFLIKFRQKLYLAVIILIILFFLLFIVQNTEQIQIIFLFWSIQLSRALVLLGSLILGIFIGTIATIMRGMWDKTANSASGMEQTKLQNRVLEQAYEKSQRITYAELTTSIADLEDANQSISVLKTEIDRLHGEIEARELIEKMIHHDLRSALIASAALPESVLSDPNLTDKQKIIVRLIRDSGEKMLEILESSLTLYRIEEGTYKKDFETVNLFKIISTIAKRIASSHSNFEHDISISCMDAEGTKSDNFPVTGDKFLLYSIFMNLLTNAVEASPRGKPISVILSKNESCSIAISNYGEVPESIRDTFFDKMVTAGKKFGTGLGTYLAMLMVKAQNGNIELNCSTPGMTTVYVHLPKA